MKKSLYFLILVLICNSALAQNDEEYNLDSLILRFNASEDTLSSVKEYVDQIVVIFNSGVPENDVAFLALIEKTLLKAKELNDKDGMAWANYHLARFYIGTYSGYSKALPVLLEAMSNFEETHNNYGISQCYMQMGLISYITEYYEDAIKNFKLSLNYASNPTSVYLMAISYGELHNYVDSKTQFHIAIKEFKALNRAKSLDECYMYLGRLYVQEGHLDSAFFYLNEALESLKKHNDKAYLTRPYALISEYYLAKGELSKAEYYALSSIKFSAGGNDNLSPIMASEVLGKLYEIQGNYEKAFTYLKLNYTLKNQDFQGGIQQKVAEIKTIFEFNKKIEQEQHRHQEEIRKKNQTRNLILTSGLFVLLFAGGLWSRLHYVRKSRTALQKEKNISENLLLNILPEEIALELKQNGEAKARSFDLVSILFTDFKGFTEASAKMSAGDLVSEINFCFEAFDGIIEKYNVEKIKTIGDAYMAAGGLPVPTDNSVKNTVLAALEMQDFIVKRKSEFDAQTSSPLGRPGGARFEMRVGIHTGPVVAGIVGVKKFQYDIWGDTVNTASRIESNGEAGKVNISQATYELLKDDADFAFESRGKIEAKGKGEMEMLFVTLKK